MKDNCLAAQETELLDDGLKEILGKRYEDMSDKFTPEAQECRRNNRAVFTLRMTAFLGLLIYFTAWADTMNLMAHGLATICISICTLVMGYFFGVCISHNKGWRD